MQMCQHLSMMSVTLTDCQQLFESFSFTQSGSSVFLLVEKLSQNCFKLSSALLLLPLLFFTFLVFLFQLLAKTGGFPNISHQHS